MSKSFPIITIMCCIVVTCFFVIINCGGDDDEVSAEWPTDSELDEIIALHEAAYDSLMNWYQSMSYEDAAQECAEWLQTQDYVDSSGISADYSVVTLFQGGIGGVIKPPRDIEMDTTALRSEPLLHISARQDIRTRWLHYNSLVLLPFDWDDHMGQDGKLRAILQDAFDPYNLVTSYKDTLVSVWWLKGLFYGPNSLTYISTHGATSASYGAVFSTGESVTRQKSNMYRDDMQAGRVILGISAGKHVYDLTPAFIEEYWCPDSTLYEDPVVGRMVYLAACNCSESKLEEAFLSSAVHVFVTFEGKLLTGWEDNLITQFFEPMTDTLSLQQSYAALPNKTQPVPPKCEIKVAEQPYGVDLIYGTVRMTTGGSDLHSYNEAGFPRESDGVRMYRITMLDQNNTMQGEFNIHLDGITAGSYPIVLGRNNSIWYDDEASNRTYQADSLHCLPEWGGSLTGGTITVRRVDDPYGVFSGTFSATLGWWDPLNPDPHPADDYLTIDNGRFKVLRDTFFLFTE